MLAAASTPGADQKLTRRRVEALLHRCGRRNDTRVVDQILADLKAPALRQPDRVEAALGLTIEGLVAIVAAMRASVEQLEAELGHEFETHPLAPVLRSAPGLGPVLAARVLAEVGDDPDRFTTANGLRAFAGTAPVTRPSGRSHYVKARKVRNKRLSDASHRWAFAALTWSPGAQAHYDRRRAAGGHHNAALRNVAQQAHRTPVVVHRQRPALGRTRRLAGAQARGPRSSRLTPDWRGMSTSAPGPASATYYLRGIRRRVGSSPTVTGTT